MSMTDLNSDIIKTELDFLFNLFKNELPTTSIGFDVLHKDLIHLILQTPAKSFAESLINRDTRTKILSLDLPADTLFANTKMYANPKRDPEDIFIQNENSEYGILKKQLLDKNCCLVIKYLTLNRNLEPASLKNSAIKALKLGRFKTAKFLLKGRDTKKFLGKQFISDICDCYANSKTDSIKFFEDNIRTMFGINCEEKRASRPKKIYAYGRNKFQGDAISGNIEEVKKYYELDNSIIHSVNKFGDSVAMDVAEIVQSISKHLIPVKTNFIKRVNVCFGTPFTESD